MPNNIANVVIVKNKLFISNINSLEVTEYFLYKINFGDLEKYNIKDEPIINVKNINIYNPLSGSFANACTETNIPDLTRKVPSKLNEKVNEIQEECKHLEYDVKPIRGTPIQVKKICKVCQMDLGFPTKDELKKAGY